MILIQSDMFKALWFMIYAIAGLTTGSIDSASVFCQISGFFTAVGIESSGKRDSSWPALPDANRSRLFGPDDCHTQRSIYIQTIDLDWRRWIIPVSLHCVCPLDHFAPPPSFARLPKSQWGLRIRWSELPSSREAFLVSARPQLDSTILHFHIHSCH